MFVVHVERLCKFPCCVLCTLCILHVDSFCHMMCLSGPINFVECQKYTHIAHYVLTDPPILESKLAVYFQFEVALSVLAK